ncbi:TrkA family potassium uptake protein [Nocardioides psychrotolerans]|uniref:potassium channel family protein n=1 Tax=Nocardioides psychrotolerans TaxID=1005945 RepID=UPI003137B312
MAKRKTDSVSVVVIGLGRFGSAVAESLVNLGQEVLAIDENRELVERWSDELTHVAQADTTDDEALRQLGVANFDRAVVAIGADIEASVLTVLALAEAGVPDIWAKAITRKHGRILERVGAHHVVYPEHSMGERVAHMLTGGMMDYIEFDDAFSIARSLAPQETWGKTLAESSPRTRHGVTIVGIKRQGEDFTYARPETSIDRHDQLIVSGPIKEVERFCTLR